MTAFPKSIDLAAWAIVTLSGLIAIVAIAGIIAVLYSSSSSGLQRAQLQLHDAYYVMQPSRAAVIPFALCFLLSSLIGCLGYTQTRKFVERKISMVEQATSSNR
jgi:hypothetical protein